MNLRHRVTPKQTEAYRALVTSLMETLTVIAQTNSTEKLGVHQKWFGTHSAFHILAARLVGLIQEESKVAEVADAPNTLTLGMDATDALANSPPSNRRSMLDPTPWRSATRFRARHRSPRLQRIRGKAPRINLSVDVRDFFARVVAMSGEVAGGYPDLAERRRRVPAK